MIKTERKTIDGVKFKHCYSDAGKYIERDGVMYEDTLDPVSAGRTYTETDVDIPVEESSEEVSMETESESPIMI